MLNQAHQSEDEAVADLEKALGRVRAERDKAEESAFFANKGLEENVSTPVGSDLLRLYFDRFLCI